MSGRKPVIIASDDAGISRRTLLPAGEVAVAGATPIKKLLTLLTEDNVDTRSLQSGCALDFVQVHKFTSACQFIQAVKFLLFEELDTDLQYTLQDVEDVLEASRKRQKNKSNADSEIRNMGPGLTNIGLTEAVRHIVESTLERELRGSMTETSRAINTVFQESALEAVLIDNADSVSPMRARFDSQVWNTMIPKIAAAFMVARCDKISWLRSLGRNGKDRFVIDKNIDETGKW